MARASILIVDDEKNILSTLSRALRIEQFDVDVAGSAAIALKKLDTKVYDLLIVDVMMPDMDGLELITSVRDGGHEVPIIVMSGHGTIETAVEATRLGAYDFIEKPISTDRLLLSIEHCLDLQKLQSENETLKRQTGALADLIGESAPMRALRQQIQLAASANAPVLIVGERGTGKELIARAIHQGSKRHERDLEKLNCAAVPSELIESELFGHEAGAFTGATKQRRGKFERAHGSTLFLDEVGDMPAAMQAKLLRVLQEGEVERVGGSELLKIDVRVVAATNRAMDRAIAEGQFRADLFDRLNVVPLRAPALRERSEDIPMLAAHFLVVACEANDRRDKTLSPGAMQQLQRYHYPGNVRELRNLIERLVILTPGDTIGESDVRAFLPIGGTGTGAGYYRPDTPLREMMDEAERDLITRALQHHQGHITNTAASLGLERSHLYKKMKALDIRRSE